jgi:peptidyl-prolyl cis-trans isomerase B (cyclophilin B)
MSRALVAVVFVLLALGLAACGGDDEDDGAPSERDQGAEQQPTQAVEQPAEEPAGACEQPDQPPPRDGGGQRKPESLDPAKTYEVVLETSCGAFTIRLDQKTSPEAAASFAALARDGFFDETIFHRIVPGFVIQGGDPTASGAGGPGYSTRDRVPRDAAYEPGVVAMAKAGNEPPGTGGSQFFVVTGEGTGLTPDYALLGEVAEGMDVVQEIGELGDPASGGAGTPLQSVVIEKATVRER